MVDDLDFSTKERVFTPRNTNVKYESSITYHSKAMANIKRFCNKQTDRRTGRTCGQTDKRTDQKLYAPDLSMRGHKIAILS